MTTTHMSRRDRLDMLLLVALHGAPPLLDKVEAFERCEHRLVAVDPEDGPVPLGRAHLCHAGAHLERGIERRVEHVAKLAVARARAQRRALLLEQRGGVDGEDLAQRREDVAQRGRSRQGRSGWL